MRRGGVTVCWYFPTSEDLELLADLFPDSDSDNPPWPPVQARLIEAKPSPHAWPDLTAPAVVAMLRKTVPAVGTAIRTIGDLRAFYHAWGDRDGNRLVQIQLSKRGDSLVRRMREGRDDHPADDPAELKEFDGLMRRLDAQYGRCDSESIAKAIACVAKHSDAILAKVHKLSIAEFNAALDVAAGNQFCEAASPFDQGARQRRQNRLWEDVRLHKPPGPNDRKDAVYDHQKFLDAVLRYIKGAIEFESEFAEYLLLRLTRIGERPSENPFSPERARWWAELLRTLGPVPGLIVDIGQEFAERRERFELDVVAAEKGGIASDPRDSDPATDSVVDESSYLAPATIAKLYRVPQNALEQRLKRWRKANSEGWREITEPKPREPRYLYLVRAVRPVIDALKATGETTGERPAKKI